MATKMRALYPILLLILLVMAVYFVAWNPLRALPGGQGGIERERYEELKARVEELRQAGYDVSYLEIIIADIENWIRQNKVAEANLRIKDLEGALNDYVVRIPPTAAPDVVLPPVPPYTPVVNAGGKMLFEENFSDPGVLRKWESEILAQVPGTMATWECRQQALYLDQGGGSPEMVGMVYVAGQEWGDYVYSVDILPEGNLEVGVVFRYNKGNFYRFRFLSGEYNPVATRLLERIEGDKTVVLDKQDGPGYESGRWYNVQVVADGENLAVYLNGELILQATDRSLRQGKIGVYALSEGYVYFDNIRVMSMR